MTAPVLAVGDGALGFWKAVREVFPETREQRCWFHKIANVLNAALPKSAQPGAKAALAEIHNAEDKTHAAAAARTFAAEYGVKWPKAAAKITDDLDVLIGFYDHPTGRVAGVVHGQVVARPIAVHRLLGALRPDVVALPVCVFPSLMEIGCYAVAHECGGARSSQ